ncbi:MAG TPA: HAMP domain-containing sensor histidine kinase [Myxococcota bacterium]|nr:HAMP domain-containing sensor histidine kinase [Myxococcota bacterium]
MQGPIADEPRDDELRRLLDAASDGLALARQGAVQWANASLARMAGVAEPKDLVGLALEEVFVDSGHGLPGGGADGPIRCRLARVGSEGRSVLVEPIAGPWAARVVALRIRDVTDLHTLESEVLRTGRALHDANRELVALRERHRNEAADREHLLTVVSHELRTPCTVIAGFNRMLLSERFGTLTERQRHFLEESQKSCQRLNSFIGNLLETARESLSVGPLEVAEASLVPMLESVAALFEPLLRERELRIELALDPATPRARFDPPRIEQVLTNLIGNALKFAPTASAIEVAARALRAGGRDYAEISVSDAGPGVDERDRQRIFDPYVQAGQGARAGGLGLGLAICRRIVEAHGGAIQVGERPGGGSRFAFTLPAAGAGLERGTAEAGA